MEKLGKTLILNKYFLELFGISEFDDLREKLKDIEENYDIQGRSYFIDVLIGLKPEWEYSLLKYDSAIRKYVEDLRKSRRQAKFNLKYFQYLAVLFTEIFLDKYYNDRNGFLNELNDFLEKYNLENRTNITPFVEEDLKKIAFWMATGSGKTLIMHINYWQILKYSQNNWDNIILITPNEGLSKQHYEELKKSNIPCKIYEGSIDDLKTRNDEVLLIDIHKLTENKKGKGVSVDISYFDGRNLVFIDEGHKGQKSEEQKWKNLREEIGKNGFLFEYSATFGQVIGKNKDLLNEYAKAILFDYSYKYFYSDGYGKDFYVYNIREDSYSELQRDTLLTAALLSFYEQLIVFEQHKEELRKHNIEKPLWIFVGSKVSGRGVNSDIVRVIQFLDKITKDENYLRENVIKILEGNSGLIDENGRDIFNDKFEYLKSQSYTEIIEGIYKHIFCGKGHLELYEIKNADGEIGVRTSTAEKYFGVINIGDVRALKKIIQESEIEVKEDHFSRSLFFEINDNETSINVLIGSKKFIEGWNSWRVSNMGLINMGKGEGPQIIQLFGRGVRLKGKDFSLKREENPDYKLRILQTLFIFGLNADYMNAFLSAIEKEDVDYEEFLIPIRFNMPNKWEGNIYTIKRKETFNFSNYIIPLTVDKKLLRNIKIDLRPKITMAHGLNLGIITQNINEPIHIPAKYFEILDWNYIYSELMNYKTSEDMSNLIINKEVLKKIIQSKKYEIYLAESDGIKIELKNTIPTLRITSFNGIKKLHDMVLTILKNYTIKFYRKAEKEKAMDFLDAEPLTLGTYSNLYPKDNRIILKIPRRLDDELKEIIKQLEEYESNNNIPESWKKWDLPIIHFDNHLFTPLIIWKKSTKEIKSVPIRLNEGETKFIQQFRDFLKSSPLLKNKEIFLLRNLSKRGIGFFFSSGFYPDFILWVKDTNSQYLVFIDPKGIRYLGNFDDEKIQFCTSYIKDIEAKINDVLEKKGDKTKLYLYAFIISVSPYEAIKTIFDKGNHPKNVFETHNIYFQEDSNYLNKVFEKVLKDK